MSERSRGWRGRGALGVALGLGLACAGAPERESGPPGSSSGASGSSSGGEGSVSAAASEGSSEGSGGTGADLGGSGTTLLRGATLAGGGPADVRVAGAMIAAVGSLEPLPGETVVELAGSFLAPGFIDSHVHLVFLPGAKAMARGGVVAAVDLAAPLSAFDGDFAPLRVVLAGPMVTAVMGYPTQGWGAGGYGIECADAAAAAAAVDLLHERGAGVIKVPVTWAPTLDDAALAAVVERSHEYGLKVASHALGDAEARRAGEAGADVLAHTPTSPLMAATRALWSKRAVISTLGAFGGGTAAVQNLADLRAEGAQVLYGTDYGNSTVAGIDGEEIALLQAAGLSPAEILAAGTSAPAAFWGLDSLGSIAAGKEASLLVLAADPLVTPAALAEPSRVMVQGEWQ